ncbi:protein STB2 [Podospora aff. communis PSN243]|uniref:Protein STB2 n=1 Tax=Podospora aff. communis PSN243 TaxID=3040156 RepID=A0AAV9H3N9_9PEZI|nr:protein STB2 [Podospora aff. communis PSN243]
MSLRRFPGSALDARAYREEDVTSARLNSQRNIGPSVLETPPIMSPSPKQESAAAVNENLIPGPPNPTRRRVVLPDPVAFRFLEEDPLVTVVDRKCVLSGYELYLVEQWACSRQSPALVIVTYTGDPKHLIVVGVLEVPKEEKDWSPRLRTYFKAIQQYHARPKETDIGELMITNLSSFPSALTVISVPDGDFRKHRQVFIVNEDLKRLGCSGRSALTLSDPTPATQAKFLQLYKTSDRIPFFQAVSELIKLCQVALFIFGKLEQEYIDGLLCDLTETAINNWWTEIGSEYFNIEPTDGILGPTTVAALLGTLMGARNRLGYYGAPVAKDVFEIECTKRGIGTFQKSQKIERTRRLDRQTLLKLHSVTAKAAAGEGGWGVRGAVKSTVAEIGGKRGELVIGMVGGRDKGNIGDIETADLDKFINLAYGERTKWLWHGKPRRTLHEPEDSIAPFSKELKEDPGPQSGRRINSAPAEDEMDGRKKEESPGVYTAPAPISAPAVVKMAGDQDALRKTVFKSVAGKVSDARSGLGRIRDAVGTGLRGHAPRPSKDEGSESMASGYTSPSIATLAHSSANLTSPVAVGRAFTWKNKPEEYLGAMKDKEGSDAISHVAHPSETEDGSVNTKNGVRTEHVRENRAGAKDLSTDSYHTAIHRGIISGNTSAAGSVVDDADLEGRILATVRSGDACLASLQHRHSVQDFSSMHGRRPNNARYARRLSFGDAEEAILRWDYVASVMDSVDELGSLEALRTQAELAHSLYENLLSMQTELAPWVTGKLADVAALDDKLGGQQADLQALYLAVNDAYQRIHHNSDELVAEERSRLAEAVKDVEVLVAKLEYEINTLVGRVLDVEDGVAHFEAQVEDVERRAEELKAVLETESWPHWFVRTLTGIGTGPNITRGPSQRGRT